jgi:diguanylate cyclase (GGDEF)-like protein
MKDFVKEGISLGKSVTILASSICLSAILFFLSKILLAGSSLDLNGILMIFAVITGMLSGLLVFLYQKLLNKAKILKKFKELASTDKLTELYNRNYLEPFLESEIDAANKTNQQISMIMVDMDHFEEINDNYGHVVGDHVLTIFAQVVLKCIRKTDIIARYGGDEFIIVLPNTDTDTAGTIAERLRQDVSDTYIPPIDGVVFSSISCSVGVSTYPVLCDGKNSLIRTSDLALYKAKHSGRNCTIVYNSNLAIS